LSLVALDGESARAKGRAKMSDEDAKAREERRRKLIGRLMILGLLALILVYLIPLLTRPH
jgi:hypothetical protein